MAVAKFTMIYLAENFHQTTLTTIFGVSQPIISRASTRVIAALNMVLPPPPDPHSRDPHWYYEGYSDQYLTAVQYFNCSDEATRDLELNGNQC